MNNELIIGCMSLVLAVAAIVISIITLWYSRKTQKENFNQKEKHHKEILKQNWEKKQHEESLDRFKRSDDYWNAQNKKRDDDKKHREIISAMKKKK